MGDDGATKIVPKLCARHEEPNGIRASSIAFLSPEQLHRAGVDHRTDIFALGVVLWQITTGHALFLGSSAIETVRRIMECKVPRPSTLVPGYPRDLEAAVLSATARSRRDRFSTAYDFAAALEPLSAPRAEVAAFVQRLFARHLDAREAALHRAEELLGDGE